MNAPDHRSGHACVLVADDDPAKRRELARCLGDAYDVVVARDGEEALRLARRHRPVVAVLDLTLAKLSGIAVAWTLRNDPRHRPIPTVLVSSPDEPPADPASPDDRDIWAESLAMAFVPGPLDHSRLLAVVARLVASEQERECVPAVEVDERRLTPRLPVSIPARIATGSREAEGVVLSLSPRGAFVKSEVLFDPGAHAAITFSTGDGHFHGDCEVLYRSEESCRGMGLLFHGLTPRDEAHLLAALGA